MRGLAAAVCLTVLMALSGCATGQGLMDMVPNAEFKRFEYNRGANFTSMHIVAINARKTLGGEIEVEKVNIIGDYGPWVNFNITLEGYRRAGE